MKTININLIGNLGKISKTSFKQAKKVMSFDTKNQIFAYILVISVILVFSASFGGWLLVKNITANLNQDLLKLNDNLTLLKEKESKLSNFRKDLKNEKEIIEFKIVIQKQINKSFLPWSSILKEIAIKIPKDIIVLKIEKSGNAREQDSQKLKISGLIPTNKKQQPLMSISFFIFNLNQNQNSLLSDAKISKLEFDDKTKTYEFEIETAIKSSNNSL